MSGVNAADLGRILSFASEDDVLVGGQALAFWAAYLEITPPPALQAGITSDIDFLSSRSSTLTFIERLKKAFEGDIKTRVGELDSGVNLATATIRKSLVIDFLGHLYGVPSNEEIWHRSVQEGLGRPLRIMHPVDCLSTRVFNLALPSKLSYWLPKSLAQLNLAMDVVRTYLRRIDNERLQLDRAEDVIALALSRPGIHAWRSFGINLLDAVPVEAMRNTKFQHFRWPQALLALAKRGRRAANNPTLQHARALFLRLARSEGIVGHLSASDVREHAVRALHGIHTEVLQSLCAPPMDGETSDEGENDDQGSAPGLR